MKLLMFQKSTICYYEICLAPLVALPIGNA
jgi:hypothetical protein